MTTKIIKCTCRHATQDVMYGAGNRVANQMRTGQLRCSVCGTVHGGVFTSRPTKAVDEPVKAGKPSSKALKGKASKGRGPKAKHDRSWGRKR